MSLTTAKRAEYERSGSRYERRQPERTLLCALARPAVRELHPAATPVPNPESTPKFRAEDCLSANGSPIGRDFALTHNRKRPQKRTRKSLPSLGYLL